MLQEKRKEMGLSQSQLAKKSLVNLQMIQFYEEGYRNINTARLETLCKLAKALDCSITAILSDNKLIKLYEEVCGNEKV